MPYNPAPYRGDAYLFQGISNAGQSIGNGIAGLADRMQEQKDEDKRRARLFKSLSETADALGIVPKDKSITMDLDTLQGVVQGHMIKQGMADADQQRQLRAAQMQDYQAQAAQRQQGVVDAQTLQQFAGALGTQMAPNLGPLNGQPDDAGDVDVPTPGLPLAQAFPRALAQHPGAVNSREFDNLVKSLQLMQGAGPDWEGVKPHEMTTSNGRRVVYGKSGQFQFEPQDFAGEGGVAQVPVLDEAGQPTGEFMIPNGRGGITRMPKAPAPRVPAEFNKAFNEIAANIAQYQGSLQDPKLAPEKKQRYTRALEIEQGLGRELVDRYHSQRALDDTQRAAHYQSLGIAGAPASAVATTGDRNAQANNIRAQFKAGKLSKGDALNQLRALGFE